jgi:hypothetical protein
MRNLSKVILPFLTLLYFSCGEDKREGSISIRYEPFLNDKEGVTIRPNNNDFTLKDTLVLRLRTGFSNDKIKVCVSSHCDEYNNVTSDLSTAIAESMKVFPIKNAQKMVIQLRNLNFSVPIKVEYKYIDISIDGQNKMTVTYSNNILLLSSKSIEFKTRKFI